MTALRAWWTRTRYTPRHHTQTPASTWARRYIPCQ